MDPETTLAVLVNAARAGDHEALLVAAEDLAEWLARGGFAPKGTRIDLEESNNE